MFFAKTFLVLAALSTSVLGHAAVAPALGAKGTTVARNNAQRPSNAKPCGNTALSAIDSSNAVTLNGNSFTVTATNFNGGRDGSTQFTAQVDPTGKGTGFKAATVTKNGEAAPKGTGNVQITVQMPAGTKCTGGAAGNRCLVSFKSAGGFAGGGNAAAGAKAGAKGTKNTRSQITWQIASCILPPNASMDDDGGDVRVYVEPGASHYHAGEIATFTISFTNTRTVPTQTPQTIRPLIARRKSEDQINAYGRTRGHRKAFSSVSEARMARPPTSPGIRRVTPPPVAKYTPLTSSSLSQPTVTRKGLIGVKKQSNGTVSSVIAAPGRSLSITIAPRNGEDGSLAINGNGTPTTPIHRGRFLHTGLVFIIILTDSLASPRATRTKNGIPLSHPHARKQSAALDGAFPVVSSHLHRIPPTTPSTASFSSSLAPITESTSLDTIATPDTPLKRTPDVSGSSTPYPDSPCTPSPDDNSALILLAHAQVTGTLTLEPPSAALAASWRVAELGSGRRVVGGGRMGIGVAPRPRAASGVGAWLGMSESRNGPSVRAALGLGGLASADSSTASLASAPPDSPPSRPFRKGHQRATSMASYIPGMSSISALLSPFGDDTAVGAGGSRPSSRASGRASDALGPGTLVLPTGGGAGAMDMMGSLGTVEQGVFPVLESQPSVLAVDLTLKPGETRKYTYSVSLPAALPPSFRGKYFRLTYFLVIGTTRPDSEADAGQLRRVIRVPIRMYNHVAEGGMEPCLSEVSKTTRRHRQVSRKVLVSISIFPSNHTNQTLAHPAPNRSLADKIRLTRSELESYARKLLVESSPNTLAAELSKMRLSPGGMRNDDDLEGANMSCRDAVEVVTRHSKKGPFKILTWPGVFIEIGPLVSYDIAKDGKTVAIITFVKASYRLGETILGAIEFNNPNMDGQVLKYPAQYSATLESTESFPLHTPAPQTRKHAEHHVAYASGAQRAAFSLDIPSDGTPTFVLRTGESAGRGTIEGGLQWRVRMALVVCMAPAGRVRYLEPDGPGNDWGEAWKASGDPAPLGPVDPKAPPAATEGWGSFFRGWTGDEEPANQESDEGWARLRPETIECELPIAVFPGSTAYQPSGFDTWA
ncbi:Rgp1 domain-containing protein [Rhizoctonia solani AG-1 IA]|uniref:Rgp1 domain-containing protein n=1 Tax=Thanatephorus cucumeris (strain AG1-IA) TaxID=983506 RepID=L8WVN1_THACA|nr:Rgp1 domain-containing protein [Rhizoctonia solani AG-1 IA]